MNIHEELYYTKSHEWVRFLDDTTVRVGLTDYAQNALGDLVFVNLPQVGDEAAQEEALGDVESVKAVSDIYSPVTGVVRAVNETLLDDPGAINADPYDAWLAEIGGITGREVLLDAAEYAQFCEEEA